jgi:hypothetical protein
VKLKRGMKVARYALVPDPLMSDSQYDRFYHLDLCELGDTELKDELNYLRPLLWGLDLRHWMRERVIMLEQELSKRQRDTRYKFSKPNSKMSEGVTL